MEIFCEPSKLEWWKSHQIKVHLIFFRMICSFIVFRAIQMGKLTKKKIDQEKSFQTLTTFKMSISPERLEPSKWNNN